jgi:hypothetical protein
MKVLNEQIDTVNKELDRKLNNSRSSWIKLSYLYILYQVRIIYKYGRSNELYTRCYK